MNQRDFILNAFDHDTRLNADGVREKVIAMYDEHLSLTALHIHLAKLAREGLLFRLKQGWYCLPTSRWTKNGRRVRPVTAEQFFA